MRGKILGWTLLLLTTVAKAQRTDAVILYINTYKELAMQEMQRTGMPAAIKLAQGIHETEAGTSDLVKQSNNHFGLKCKATWTGAKVYHDDDARGECFRSYEKAEDSYRDQSDFLKGSPRYAGLFQLDPADYKGWAWGLKKAGYATNNAYPQILIKYIEDYNLQQYSLIALGRMKAQDEVLLAGNPKVNVPAESGSIGTALIDTKPITLPEPPHPDYPAGEFELNKTRVVYAPAGTALLAEAEHFGIPYARLLEFNDLKDGDILRTGQLLYLQRKRKTGAAETHVVVPGETVYSICQSEGLRLENLMEYNLLESGMQPAAGETIYLVPRAQKVRPRLNDGGPAAARQPVPPPASQPMANQPAPRPNMDSMRLTINGPITSQDTTHIVQPKETLYSISKKYGVSLEQLKTWNKLDSLSLRTGQQLVIHKN
ncbi:MAG: LysM peptidoglycan-binding domain-containing protein [Bacteroidetes bacterium]|nr:LysM peptidoglycan-binding domain-containing protein [Bacteroidota bacterium]